MGVRGCPDMGLGSCLTPKLVGGGGSVRQSRSHGNLCRQGKHASHAGNEYFKWHVEYNCWQRRFWLYS